MPKKLPQRDPIGAYQREATAARRVGIGKQCACGEARPEALIEGSEPIVCAACDRKGRENTTFDNHHVSGRANGPVTMPVPVNDHRAILSIAQYDWPKETRENPEGSPFLAAAAYLRGFIDTVSYLLDKLFWIAEMLEMAHAIFVKKLGPRWWRKSDLKRFEPKRR